MQSVLEDRPITDGYGIIHHSEGVDLLPSNIELSGLEVSLINTMSREFVLKDCLSKVMQNYDYILIDCMPSLGVMTINALAAANSVIIPTQPSYLSTKGLSLLLRSISKVKRQINPKLRIDGILKTSDLYRESSFEAKKMIVSQFVKTVRVGRDYNIEVEFNVSFEDFQQYCIENGEISDATTRLASA